jgi:hypothetical protein
MDASELAGYKIHRWLLVLLTVAGSVIGLVPFALVLGRPRLLLYVAAGCALLSSGYAYLSQAGKARTTAANAPGVLEYLLGGVGRIYLPALGGIVSLFVYIVVYGLAWLLGAILGWVGLQVQIVPDTVAIYPAAILAVLWALAGGYDITSLRDQLYQDVAGTKSVFYDLIARHRGRLIGCSTLALVALGAALALFLLRWGVGTVFYVLLQVYLAGVSGPLWGAGELDKVPFLAVRAVRKLLREAGYQTVESPKTGDEKTDPLLANVNLLAYDEERAFALQVRTSGRSTGPVDWTAASALQSAAWTLDEYGQAFGLTSQRVKPLMVLVGVRPDESLVEFSEERDFRLAEIADWNAIGQIVSTEDKGELRELAGRYLGLEGGGEGEDAARPDDGTDAHGGEG